MKIHAVVAAVILPCAVFGLLARAGDLKEDTIKKDLEALKGTWTPIAGQRDGKKIEVKGVTLTYDGRGRASVQKGAKLLFEGTIKIDSTKKPRTLDATQTSDGDNKGKTFLGIYELDGDMLKVCSTEPAGKDRPTEFSSEPGSGHFLRIYKREKK